MKKRIWARYLKSPLPWALAATLVLGAIVPAAASAGGPDHQTATSWASYHPRGWSAGSVARGTGYRRPGASRRVREVQRRLDRLDYPTGKVDGFFGPITDGAVRQYQRENALRADGIVGPRTLHDLRTRTRRGQGSADRETSAAKPSAGGGNAQTAVWSEREATSSPRWWTLMPLLAAALAIVLGAVGLSLRALSGRALRRRRATPPRQPFESNPGRFSVLGARIHLAQARPIDSSGTLLVELELFLEGDRRRWETGILGSGRPFSVSLADLEESVRAVVVPDYLPALAEALGKGGFDIGLEELNKLTFAIEPTIEVERAMAERGEAFPIAG